MIEHSSDPLPYTQLDRAVKAVASRLGSVLGVPSQHALGGLAEFWELCGDPRELDRLLERGIREVVLSRDEVMRKFWLGLGLKPTSLTADDLVAFGLLEPRGPGADYRVRGMSRYFRVIEARRHKRMAGSAGGKASAKVRAEKYGTAQPRPTPPRSESASESASGGASECLPQPTLFPEAESEAASKQRRTQRTEDSGQSSIDRSPVNANAVWAELVVTFEHHGLATPEIHPRERNNRIHSLLKQLPRPDPVLLDQVLFVALEHFPRARGADNPLGYLQTMLALPESKAKLLALVDEAMRQSA